eukprot:TRINITY_DN14756_c1_g1_i1.p1 TRINITY_DN14756_c1_g1~~TRINITY_DN14756_c1_g1_i1.p1  ORF type:complete len:485 (+),score=109.34 TRINITY_DN14756_c1_g1_i1:50-1504(+)
MASDNRNTFLPISVDDLVSEMCTLTKAADDFREMSRSLQIVVGVYYDAMTGRIRKGLEKSTKHTTEDDNKFLRDIIQLMQAGQYELLGGDKYEDAMNGRYSFKFPCDITWDKLDGDILKTFYQDEFNNTYPAKTTEPSVPHFAERLMVLTRGSGEVVETGLFIDDKINLILEVVWAKILRTLRITSPSGSQDTAGHNDQIHRQSLEDVAKKEGLLNILLKKIEIREPTFQDVVILHYPKQPEAPVSPKKNTKGGLKNRKDPPEPLPEADENVNDNGVEIELFRDVPYGDLEGAMPFKDISLRPLDTLTIGGMILAAIAVILLTLSSIYTGEAEGSGLMLLQILVAVIGRQLSALVTAYRNLRVLYREQTREWVQRHNTATGIPVISQLADDVKNQELKELLIAYFFLWVHGPSTAEETDTRCEAFLLRSFSMSLNFDVDDAIDKLVSLGLIAKEKKGDRYHIIKTPIQWNGMVPTKYLDEITLR